MNAFYDKKGVQTAPEKEDISAPGKPFQVSGKTIIQNYGNVWDKSQVERQE